MKKLTVILGIALIALVLSGGFLFRSAFANQPTVSADRSSAHHFSSKGTGTEMSISPVTNPPCQNQPAPSGCTVQTNGTATTTISGLTFGTGPYMSVITVFWNENTPNGQGGFCAPASGPSQLVASDGDSLNILDYGTVCEVGPTGNNVPHTFTGKFLITGGTGAFQDASGSGTIKSSDDGFGHSTYSASGTIKIDKH